MEYIVDKQGKRRKAILVHCDSCDEEFLKEERFVIKNKNHFCSSVCKKAHGQAELVCANTDCGKLFSRPKSDLAKGKNGIYFCCRACKDKAQRIGGICAIQPPHYGLGNGLHDYRERAIEYYGESCEICGAVEHPSMIQVHHIDGDRSNNDLKNLIVLCANHHVVITVKAAVLENRKLRYLGEACSKG